MLRFFFFFFFFLLLGFISCVALLRKPCFTLIPLFQVWLLLIVITVSNSRTHSCVYYPFESCSSLRIILACWNLCANSTKEMVTNLIQWLLLKLGSHTVAIGFLCTAACIAELFFQYCTLSFKTLLFQIPQHDHHYQYPVWMGLDHSKMLISFRQLYAVLPALSLTVRTSKCYFLALAPSQTFRFQFCLLKTHSNRNGYVE